MEGYFSRTLLRREEGGRGRSVRRRAGRDDVTTRGRGGFAPRGSGGDGEGALGELHRVRDDGVETRGELMGLPAAEPALAVSHVIPGVRRDARADEALVEALEPTEMLVDAVRPHHDGDGRRALVGEPRLGVYRRAVVGDARERPFLGLHHSLPRGRGCEDMWTRHTAPDERDIIPNRPEAINYSFL